MPLWNFSSMGGTMRRTSARILVVVTDISGEESPEAIVS